MPKALVSFVDIGILNLQFTSNTKSFRAKSQILVTDRRYKNIVVELCLGYLFLNSFIKAFLQNYYIYQKDNNIISQQTSFWRNEKNNQETI